MTAGTLFDVEPAATVRQRQPLPKGEQRPVWSKYTAKAPHRCDECVVVAYELLPGPIPGIASARWSRRQDGVTRLYCNPHQQEQRAEDRETWKEKDQ